MNRYIYGIDFGTSNSSLAILEVHTHTIVKVFSTPSLLFFPKVQQSRRLPFQYAVGKAAIEQYVANSMEGRFMKSIKAVLPNKSFTKTRIAGKWFNAENLVALIVEHLKKQADDYLGEAVKTVVMGRPVVFSTASEKDNLAHIRLWKAAKIAGFNTIYFQMEPIAAAFTYERQLLKNELVLVGDFGGGTSDFTLMRLNPAAITAQNRQNDMLAKGGIYIGGDNFDSRIMWYRGTPHFGKGVKERFANKWLDLPGSYFTKICSWQKMNFLNSLRMRGAIERSYVFSGHDYRVKNLLTLLEHNLGYALFQQIERAKIALTQQNTGTFAFNKQGIVIEEHIDIQDFEQKIIHAEVAKINAYLTTFLQQQLPKHKAVDTVFLTGGTSMVRAIKRLFDQNFGKEKVKSGDNFTSVAKGLAFSYPFLQKQS